MFTEKKIIIVEDSYTIRYQVKMMLEKEGWSLLETANELDMYNMITKYEDAVGLILMDITLKNEDGLDLVEKLRNSRKYHMIPVIMLTEHADASCVLRAKKLGVHDYIRKPIKKDELVNRVNKLLPMNRVNMQHV